jgi:class 3 adenylate cyclase
MERRLAAILASDMVGFSRLNEKDQDGVLARQKRHRKDLIDPEIARHRGERVNSWARVVAGNLALRVVQIARLPPAETGKSPEASQIYIKIDESIIFHLHIPLIHLFERRKGILVVRSLLNGIDLVRSLARSR